MTKKGLLKLAHHAKSLAIKYAILSVLAATISWLCVSAHAAEYFVSLAGSDSASGSASSPWRTIQRAADVALPGDVVTIREGIYREWVNPANAGRADAPITYRAEKNGAVVITGADPVTGWTRRSDGLWTVRINYNTFGGLNPFTDFISGDWFEAREPCFRTRLIQDGKPLRLHDRGWMTRRETADDRFLVNIAGLTSGSRTVPGAAAIEKTAGIKPGCATKWGVEMGWIIDGSTLVYAGFDFSSPGSRRLKLHTSCRTDATLVDVCDAAKPQNPLATVKIPVTGEWQRYMTTEVQMPDCAADVKNLLLRVRAAKKIERDPDHRARLRGGHAIMIPGVVSGTIVAAFEKDPNVDVPELIVRPVCFYPSVEHRDYITVRGIVFCNAGPNWAPPTSEQSALVGTNWSRGWVIEDCEVRGTECSGITLGKYGDEFDNVGATAQNYHNTIMRCVSNGLDRVGHHILRRCRVTDCGQAGICGSLGAMFSTIEDCEVSYCHWEKPFTGAEMGGIKIHGAVDFTIANCRIHHCGNHAVWLDWMAQGSCISGNRFWANDRDLFFEVDHGPILVEGNDLLSDEALWAWSQGAAFVGNRIRGSSACSNEDRRTPVFKPHSVALASLDEIACGSGAFVFINNIVAHAPIWEEAEYPNRAEDNWLITKDCWKVDETTGACTIVPPADSRKPDFRPVDVKRLGKPPFVDQEFPTPSLSYPGPMPGSATDGLHISN